MIIRPRSRYFIHPNKKILLRLMFILDSLPNSKGPRLKMRVMIASKMRDMQGLRWDQNEDQEDKNVDQDVKNEDSVRYDKWK